MKKILLLLFLANLQSVLLAQAPDLTPWTSHPYGNEWIDYQKSYARIGINADGVYKVSFASLTGNVPGISATNFQIWHRGKQVTPLQVSPTEVVFWAVKNDGASDGLLFRPGPESRLDQTTSFYSEESSYFFTTGTPAAIAKLNGSPTVGVTSESYHTQTLVRNSSKLDPNGQRLFPEVYTQYAANKASDPNTPYLPNMFVNFGFNSAENASVPYNQSFFVGANAYLTIIASTPGSGFRNAMASPSGVAYDIPQKFTETVNLTELSADPTLPITLEYALHGVRDVLGDHQYQVSVSPTESGLFTGASFTESGTLQKLSGKKVTNLVLQRNTHISANGAGYFGLRTTAADRVRDVFGFSYYSISYPQKITLNGVATRTFYFKNNVSGKRKINLENASSATLVYDITNPYNPRQIENTVLNGSTLQFDVDRVAGAELRLQAFSSNTGVTTVGSQKIYPVSFDLLESFTNVSPNYLQGKMINPAAYDLLIVTHDNTSKNILAGARQYATYRGLPEGGSHRTLLISARNIYNQFNYGEPSPLAIRRFVDYMIKDETRNEHNLFLIGHSVSHPIRVKSELATEVPTMGDPGSDGLLVSQLSNSVFSDPDIPAIPVGRLVAFSSTDVSNYLNKVKSYELQSSSYAAEALAWRKNILEISGTKEYSELTSFKKHFTDAEAKIKHNNSYPWQITFKDNSSYYSGTNPPLNTQPAVNDLKNYINNGVGVLSYFGHGNATNPFYNFNTPDQYTNSSGLYPFMYITGCGIGNVFTSHDVLTLATKWITTADRGAIAMVANSYDAYVSSARDYLIRLYGKLFVDYDNLRKPLGRTWQEIARNRFEGLPAARVMALDDQALAHFHQTNIYGDPTLQLLKTNTGSLPVNLATFTATLTENLTVRLRWETTWEKDNDRFEIQRSLDGKKFETIGSVSAKGDGEGLTTYYFSDNTPADGINYYRLKQIDIAASGASAKATNSNIVSVMVGTGKEVKLYPNPASETVTLSGFTQKATLKWTLVSISGQKIRSGSGLQVELKGLPVGVYVVEMTEENGSTMRKQIIKK
ncbi:hypothetical protein GCM10023091_19800 [Ravibacter arvi]|uniref:Secreted protein (Por secretion system target) n=1 Tax=Ravibacter arvi TaxID=2051041 RepID=A0ABP8LWG8_9BACT